MPEAVSRSSVSQIASYGPPEELSTQAPKTEVKTSAPAQNSAESMPLEKADKKQMSYEKCIALHEREAQEAYGVRAAIGGCVQVGIAGAALGLALLKTPQGTAAGAVIGCIAGLKEEVAGFSGATVRGTTEGKIACDDLPKKQ